jgi:hypothetical protein
VLLSAAVYAQEEVPASAPEPADTLAEAVSEASGVPDAHEVGIAAEGAELTPADEETEISVAAEEPELDSAIAEVSETSATEVAAAHLRQEKPAKPAVALSVGFEFGVSVNELNTSAGYRAFTSYESLPGLVFGVPVLFSFGERFALGSGLRYVQKAYKYKRSFPLYGEIVDVYSDYTNGFVQVPLFAEFSLEKNDWRVFFDLGATLGFWAQSARRGEWANGIGNPFDGNSVLAESFGERVEFDKERDNRFESALFVGFGVGYSSDVALSVQYHYGLTDLQKDYMRGLVPRYNNTVIIQISAYYKRGLK